MAPGSRPPLTSRIRASFEGTRKSFEGGRRLSKSGRTTSDGPTPELRSPTAPDSEHSGGLHTNGFITQDPESIRNAVEAAINGEAFQIAIAANMARLLKPSIKTALDTIQPVVEAVYTHEILLRKTNQSIEDILSRLEPIIENDGRRESVIDTTYSPPGTLRPAEAAGERDIFISRDVGGSSVGLVQFKELLDEARSKTAAEISQLSTAIDGNSSKIAEVAQGVSDINASIQPTREHIESLRASSEQANTTTSVLQAQLDQLQADIGQILDSIGAGIGGHVQAIRERSAAQDDSLLSSHTTKLDLIATDLATLKGHSDTAEKIEAVASEFILLKASVDVGNASNSQGFKNVLNAVAEHAVSLDEIKGQGAHPEILAGLQQSNDSHTAHAAALGDIKDRSLGVETSHAPGGGVDRTDMLQELKADLESLRENIQAGLTSNNDSAAELEEKLNTVLTTIEGHQAANPSAEILAAVQQSNDSHASHTAALEGIKSNIAGVGPVAESDDLGPQVAAIAQKLDEHSVALDEIKGHGDAHAATLDDIKTTTAQHAIDLDGMRSPGIPPTPTIAGPGLAALEIQIGSIIHTLETHSAAWNDIKSRNTPEESASKAIVASSGDHVEAEGPFSTIIETLVLHTSILNEIKDDVSAEVFTSLHELSQAQINHTNMLAEIREADLSDEILTLLHASGESHANSEDTMDKIYAAVLASDEKLDGHAIMLGEAKDRSLSSPAEGSNSGGLEAQIGGLAAKMDGHEALLSAINVATASSNDSHASHAVALDHIRDATQASNESHTAHAATLTDLKDATSALIENHASHAAALSEIKDAAQASNEAHTSHTAALTELKSAPSSTAESSGNSADLSSLETHLNTIISTLESQTTTLSTIHESTTSAEVLDAIKSSHDLIATNHDLLTSHGPLLEAIKASSSHADILNNLSELRSIVEDARLDVAEHGALVKDLHAGTKDSHSSITQAIGALALGGAAGAGATAIMSDDEGSSKAVLAEVKAVKALVEKSGEDVSSIKTQIDINHTTITTSITTFSDELKAEIDASGTGITESIVALSGDIKDIPAADLTALHTSIDQHSEHLKSISSQLDTIDSGISDASTKVAELHDGVHFNDRGVGQLKDHIEARSVAAAPDTEGSWFGKSSPSRIRTRAVGDDVFIDEEAKEPHPRPVSRAESRKEVDDESIVLHSIPEESAADEVEDNQPLSESAEHALAHDEPDLMRTVEIIPHEDHAATKEHAIEEPSAFNHPALDESLDLEESTAEDIPHGVPAISDEQEDAEPSAPSHQASDDSHTDPEEEEPSYIISEREVPSDSDTAIRDELDDDRPGYEIHSDIPVEHNVARPAKHDEDIDDAAAHHGEEDVQEHELGKEPKQVAKHVDEPSAAAIKDEEDDDAPEHEIQTGDYLEEVAIAKREDDDDVVAHHEDHDAYHDQDPEVEPRHLAQDLNEPSSAVDEDLPSSPFIESPSKVVDAPHTESHPSPEITPSVLPSTPIQTPTHPDDEDVVASAVQTPTEPALASPTSEAGDVPPFPSLDEKGPLTSPTFASETETDLESASTSAFASPTSPSFTEGPSIGGKKGKKGKKEKKEKAGKKGKGKKEVFEMDGEEAE